MKLVHILLRDNEFADEYTDYSEPCEYDRHFLVSTDEYTDKKKAELKALLELYDEYVEFDFDGDSENEKYNDVADTSRYNLIFEFFNQFTDYYSIDEVYIG